MTSLAVFVTGSGVERCPWAPSAIHVPDIDVYNLASRTSAGDEAHRGARCDCRPTGGGSVSALVRGPLLLGGALASSAGLVSGAGKAIRLPLPASG